MKKNLQRQTRRERKRSHFLCTIMLGWPWVWSLRRSSTHRKYSCSLPTNNPLERFVSCSVLFLAFLKLKVSTDGITFALILCFLIFNHVSQFLSFLCNLFITGIDVDFLGTQGRSIVAQSRRGSKRTKYEPYLAGPGGTNRFHQNVEPILHVQVMFFVKFLRGSVTVCFP